MKRNIEENEETIEPEFIEDRRPKNRHIYAVSYLFVGLFLSLIGYLVYFQIFQADSINHNRYNTRRDNASSEVVRGKIVSDDGVVLAESYVDEWGNESRNYPQGSLFAHVVGYASNGKSGVESTNNYELMKASSNLLNQLQESESQGKVQGDNVILTLNSTLQQAAYYALGDYQGAVIAMEPKTGKILAMVSKPDFDPNTIPYDWDTIVNDESNSSLLNRATQGLYAPGSTFKIVTTLAYMRSNPDYASFSYDCTGSYTSQDNVTITCYNQNVHGQETLQDAFAYSCNTAFSNIGLALPVKTFQETVESVGFNKDFSFGFPLSTSKFYLDDSSSQGDIMTTSIGQGNTLVTPMHLLLIASAVANGGVAMTPYYVDHTETSRHSVVSINSPKTLGTFMTQEEAAVLKQYMTSVVQYGTGQGLAGASYSAAGKTGSAEYQVTSDGYSYLSTNSWFVGFSNVENPELAVVVIAEDGGSGSATAVPIAKQVFDSYYANY